MSGGGPFRLGPCTTVVVPLGDGIAEIGLTRNRGPADAGRRPDTVALLTEAELERHIAACSRALAALRAEAGPRKVAEDLRREVARIFKEANRQRKLRRD